MTRGKESPGRGWRETTRALPVQKRGISFATTDVSTTWAYERKCPVCSLNERRIIEEITLCG